MTALLAIENGNLNDIVETDASAYGTEGSSIYLDYEEKISLKDLLYGLMLSSGNDAAVAIAVHIGKGTNKFAEMMNARAKSIGALNTNFVTPNGLHDEGGNRGKAAHLQKQKQDTLGIRRGKRSKDRLYKDSRQMPGIFRRTERNGGNRRGAQLPRNV